MGADPDTRATAPDRATIGRALASQIDEIGRLFSGLDPAALAAPQGSHWSPGQHLDHLNRSAAAVARGMRQPKLMLRVLFGESEIGSRTSDQIVAAYRECLAKGGRATGRFVPGESPERPDRDWAETLVSDWWKAGARLLSQVKKWSESDLDRHRLPHPLLGKLTVREMLFFTLYHNEHHAARVLERG